MQRFVIAGFGFMGKTHAMNILDHPGTQLIAIVDLDPEKALEAGIPAVPNISASPQIQKSQLYRPETAWRAMRRNWRISRNALCRRKNRKNACPNRHLIAYETVTNF